MMRGTVLLRHGSKSQPPAHPASLCVRSRATWAIQQGDLKAELSAKRWTRAIQSAKALEKRYDAMIATPVEASPEFESHPLRHPIFN